MVFQVKFCKCLIKPMKNILYAIKNLSVQSFITELQAKECLWLAKCITLQWKTIRAIFRTNCQTKQKTKAAANS